MINVSLVMRYIFILLLLPLTRLLFASGATDVAFKGLNGPVKYREEGPEKFWFDKDGYLVCAFKCNTVGVCITNIFSIKTVKELKPSYTLIVCLPGNETILLTNTMKKVGW